VHRSTGQAGVSLRNTWADSATPLARNSATSRSWLARSSSARALSPRSPAFTKISIQLLTSDCLRSCSRHTSTSFASPLITAAAARPRGVPSTALSSLGGGRAQVSNSYCAYLMRVKVPELSAQPRSETPNTKCSGAPGPRSSVTVGVIWPEARVRPYEQARHGSFCAHQTSLTCAISGGSIPTPWSRLPILPVQSRDPSGGWTPRPGCPQPLQAAPERLPAASARESRGAPGRCCRGARLATARRRCARGR
jgi:hypothetical protein